MAGTIISGGDRILTNTFDEVDPKPIKCVSSLYIHDHIHDLLPVTSPNIIGNATVPNIDINEANNVQQIINTRYVVDLLNATVGDDAFKYADNFTFTIQSVNASSVSIKLTSPVNMIIDWGDGSQSSPISSTSIVDHVYQQGGIFEVKLSGISAGIAISGDDIIDIASFGSHQTTAISCYIAERGGCPRLRLVPSTLPDTVTDCSNMFNGASSINTSRIRSWNVSNVLTMINMFMNANTFNQSLSNWCVINIPIAPVGFASGAISWTSPKPIWGTCP